MYRNNTASRLIRIVFLWSLPMATGGCGLMLVQGPPAGHEQMESFSCTQGDAGPVVDLMLAGVGGVMAVWAANQAHYSS